MAAETYPRTDLLVEPTELASANSQFVILDARDRAKYDQGHIPNARWVDHATWAKSFQDGKDAEGWSKKIADLGIASDSKVVIYDDDWNKEAARIWWILKYWDVADVRLLNGGWKSWTAASLPSQKDTPPSPTATKFVAKSQADRLATKQKLLDSLKDKNLQIVDARTEGEFCGTEKMNNKRAGAIPGAKHLEWIDLLDKRTQRFKTARRNRQTLRRRRDRPEREDRYPLSKWWSSLGHGVWLGIDGSQRREQLLPLVERMGKLRRHAGCAGETEELRRARVVTHLPPTLLSHRLRRSRHE